MSQYINATQVDHPSHYNNHASGIEAIDLCEILSFNIGNTFKYIFRRGDKGKSVQDCEKALWYLRREIGRLTKIHDEWSSNTEFTPVPRVLLDKTPDHTQMISRLLGYEPNTLIKSIYQLIMGYDTPSNLIAYIANLQYAESDMLLLIQFEKELEKGRNENTTS